MAYTQKQIEWLHNNGYMPDWIYYQQNGKSIQENWEEQHRKKFERIRQSEEEQRRAKEIEAVIEAEIEKKLPEALDKALDELLRGFNSK